MSYMDEAVEAAKHVLNPSNADIHYYGGDVEDRAIELVCAILSLAEPFIRKDERARLEGQLRKALDALEVAALGGYEERLMPEDTLADPYEARKLVAVTQDYSGEYSCHWTPEGIDFVRTTIEETRVVLASHPTPDGETESFSGFEILTAAWGDGLQWLTVKITDPEQESKVVRLVPEPDGPASPPLTDEDRERLEHIERKYADAKRRFETRPEKWERDRARGEQRAYNDIIVSLRRLASQEKTEEAAEQGGGS